MRNGYRNAQFCHEALNLCVCFKNDWYIILTTDGILGEPPDPGGRTIVKSSGLENRTSADNSYGGAAGWGPSKY